jgi:glucose-6-phosphate 1-epimerase
LLGFGELSNHGAAWSALQVSLHAGQVVSWKNDRGEEQLFTSTKVQFFLSPFTCNAPIVRLSAILSAVFDVQQAVFKPPYAMRGGIQMCFPQVLYRMVPL